MLTQIHAINPGSVLLARTRRGKLAVLIATLLSLGAISSIAASDQASRTLDTVLITNALKTATNPAPVPIHAKSAHGRLVAITTRAIDFTALPEAAFGDRD